MTVINLRFKIILKSVLRRQLFKLQRLFMYGNIERQSLYKIVSLKSVNSLLAIRILKLDKRNCKF